MDRQNDPGVQLTRTDRMPVRWLTVFAIGAIAVLALAIAKPWNGPAVADALPRSGVIAPSASASASGATPQPVGWAPLDRHAWFLDFERSGLSPVVCMGYEGSTCPSHGQLASSIRFRDDQVLGGTGVGGGCDQFTGTLEFPDQEPGVIKIAIPVYESRCYDTGVDKEIRDRLNRAARWQPAADLSSDNPQLMLLDSDGNQLLVYVR